MAFSLKPSLQLWIFSLFWSRATLEKECPSVCKCIYIAVELQIDCSFRDIENTEEIHILPASSVNFSHNNIVQIHAKLPSYPNLKSLDLSYNIISDLTETFADKFKNLESLNLSHNMITYLPKHVPEKLKLLTLSYNRIKIIDLSVLSRLVNLQGLYVDFNAITSVSSSDADSFQSNKTLQSLHIVTFRGNKLESFPSHLGLFLRNVKKLSLCNNSLTIVSNDTFKNLLFVNYLDLSWNKLNNVDRASFTRNSYLKYLLLSHNALSYLPRGLPMLEWLDISFNQITKIGEQQSSDLYPQEMFLIGGNPFHCDCELLWLKEYYHTREYLKTIVRVDLDKFVPICGSPSRLVNYSWDVIDDSSFGCSENSDTGGLEASFSEHDINIHSWKVNNFYIEIKEVRDTFVKIVWNSAAVKSDIILIISIHPFGKKHEQKKMMLDISLGKYVIQDLEDNTPYVICISVVSTDGDLLQSDMIASLNNCHELVTMEMVINSNILHSIIFYLCLFLCSVMLYYFSLWVSVLNHVYNLMQFIRTDCINVPPPEASHKSEEKNNQ